VKHNPGGVFKHFWIVETFPETNIAPENRPLEKEIPIESYHFWEQTLSFRECNPCNPEPLGNDSQFDEHVLNLWMQTSPHHSSGGSIAEICRLERRGCCPLEQQGSMTRNPLFQS